MSDSLPSTDGQIKLYSALVDQLQKYNSIIWQAPAALLAANLFAVDKLITKPSVLLGLSIFNAAFIYAFHKMVLRQRSLIDAARAAEAKLKPLFPDFVPSFREHPLLKVPAPALFASTLWILDLVLVAYSIYAIRDGVNSTAFSIEGRSLSVAGLALNFLGTVLILVHTFKTTGATTSADQAFVASPWWFRTGLICLALGFVLQIIASLR